MSKTKEIKVSLEVMDPDWNLLFSNTQIYNAYVELLKSHYAYALMDFNKEGAMKIEQILSGLVTSHDNWEEEQKEKNKATVPEILEDILEESTGQTP